MQKIKNNPNMFKLCKIIGKSEFAIAEIRNEQKAWHHVDKTLILKQLIEINELSNQIYNEYDKTAFGTVFIKNN